MDKPLQDRVLEINNCASTNKLHGSLLKRDYENKIECFRTNEYDSVSLNYRRAFHYGYDFGRFEKLSK